MDLATLSFRIKLKPKWRPRTKKGHHGSLITQDSKEVHINEVIRMSSRHDTHNGERYNLRPHGGPNVLQRSTDLGYLIVKHYPRMSSVLLYHFQSKI